MLIAGAAALYWYQVADDGREAAGVIEAVGRHIVLPEGEVPTVATVNDVEQLAGLPFFAQAEVGHKVLIYTGAKKAILYDPEIDKLIEVAPLNVGEDSAAN